MGGDLLPEVAPPAAADVKEPDDERKKKGSHPLRKSLARQQQICNGKRTDKERQDAVDAFDLLLERGYDAKDAARRLRVGRSTIYRYKQIIGERDFLRPKYVIPSINNVISALTEEKSDKIDIISMIDFVCWLRWPESKQNLSVASVFCLASYVSQAGARRDADLRDSVIEALNSRLSAELIVSIMSGISYPPDFELTRYWDNGRDEVDQIISLVAYLLGHGKVGRRNSASINKAAFLADMGLIGYGHLSARTLRKKWHALGSSTPFWYVARLHSSFSLDIDPTRMTFFAEMNEIINDRREFLTYLGKCRWVVQEIETILDRRALTSTVFPSFPAAIKPIAIEAEPLSEQVRLALIKRHKISL